MSRFRFSRAGNAPDDPWFRIGTVEVTTTLFVVILCTFFFVLSAFEAGMGAPINGALVLFPEKLLTGQVWRLVTWPLASPGFSLWTALSIFFFWYFGRELENDVGRVRFAKFIIGLTLLLGIAAVLLYLVWPYGALATIDAIQLMVLLTFIVQNPTRPFFFGIPAWALGAVIVGLAVLSRIAGGDIFGLLHLMLSLLVTAVLARSVGLLSDHTWVPAMKRVKRPPKRPKPTRSTGPTVVTGPWQGSSASSHEPVNSHQAELDSLLDKISESGMDSLTDAEKRRLLDFRDRLRGNK